MYQVLPCSKTLQYTSQWDGYWYCYCFLMHIAIVVCYIARCTSKALRCIKVNWYSFCPFSRKFYGWSLWYGIDQCTYFLNRLFNDIIAPHSTSNIIQCQIHRIFVSNDPLKIKNWIDWDYFNVINHRIGDQMNKINLNVPL